jgi:UDP-N-acetylglucosamine--N-acetylmuramyl-(pentapeptide) pyrophosphoryl-undecaprenol N-acetylglucosamine transferase
MSDRYNILVSGGGTGGHIFPAVAIANSLKKRLGDVNILFVGAKGKMEMEKVPQAGYPIEGLWISGLQRKLDLRNLLFPFKVIISLFRAKRIVKKFNAHAAVGTGGYASGPLLYMASRRKLSTLILEQNSYPGITNKMLGKTVEKVCVAYDGMEKYFPSEKIVVTEAPIRKEILDLKPAKEEALEFFGLIPDKPVLLIIGGSQGARRINEVIAEKLDLLLESGMQIIWQTGRLTYDRAQERANQSSGSEFVKVHKFISRMDMAYAACDLIISRAGAIAIAEIIAVKKPAILVPLPSAAEDHQTRNASTLVKGHAALMVKERDAEENLAETVIGMMKNKSDRLVMVQNLKRFEHPDATEKIVDEILKLIEKK